MEKFTPATCKQLNDEIKAALQQVLKNHNLKFISKGGTFDAFGLTWNPKYEFQVIPAAGEKSKAQLEFEKHAETFGLKAADFGRSFTCQDQVFTITGLKLSAFKRPVLAASKGKVYAYFNTGRKTSAGKPVYLPLPPYGSPGFFDSYSSFRAGRNRQAEAVKTVSTLSASYQRSDSFKSLSEGTKRVYLITLRKIIDEYGDFPLEDVTRASVYALLDEIPGASSRNLFVAVLGVLFRFGRQRDMTEANPVKDIPKFKTGEHEPWPSQVLEAALKSDNELVRLSVHLLYYSGQRLGDALAMRWSDVRNGKIVMRQQKTGKPLSIYMHSALEAELANTAKRGMTIIADAAGKPISPQRVRLALKAFAADMGVTVVPHGLRKNAVNILLTNGCTIPEVQAITGQSVEMVMHYAKQVDQGALGEAAILKFERGNRT